jgi:hypothetical protein
VTRAPSWFTNSRPTTPRPRRAATPRGGWSLVVRYFREQKYLQALQFNRYLVVQIDTDVAEEYGVDRQVGGKPLDHNELVQAAIAVLCNLIPP